MVQVMVWEKTMKISELLNEGVDYSQPGPITQSSLGQKLEYGIPVRFEQSQFNSARWLSGEKDEIEKFVNVNKGHMAMDHDGDPVYMTRLQWDIDRVERDYPNLNLTSTKDIMV